MDNSTESPPKDCKENHHISAQSGLVIHPSGIAESEEDFSATLMAALLTVKE